MTRELIFLDVETTGLDHRRNDLVELTYATLQGQPQTLYFGVEKVPPFIDDLIKFTERGIAGRWSPEEDIDLFRQVSKDQTMVSANPKFDSAFLDEFSLNEFHYRTLDIESYALAKMPELGDVPGMKTIYDELVKRGYAITEPDHTSRNDVLALRDCYRVLRWAGEFERPTNDL